MREILALRVSELIEVAQGRSRFISCPTNAAGGFPFPAISPVAVRRYWEASTNSSISAWGNYARQTPLAVFSFFDAFYGTAIQASSHRPPLKKTATDHRIDQLGEQTLSPNSPTMHSHHLLRPPRPSLNSPQSSSSISSPIRTTLPPCPHPNLPPPPRHHNSNTHLQYLSTRTGHSYLDPLSAPSASYTIHHTLNDIIFCFGQYGVWARYSTTSLHPFEGNLLSSIPARPITTSTHLQISLLNTSSSQHAISHDPSQSVD